MKLVESIDLAELTEMAARMSEELVKGVVDVERDLLVLDADMHVDEEQYLLESGSQQPDLWGVNLYPSLFGTDGFVEFDSIINIRPRQQNRSRGVEDPAIRGRIMAVVMSKVVG